MLDSNEYYTIEYVPLPYQLRVGAAERSQSMPTRRRVTARRRRGPSEPPYSEENRDHFEELAAVAKMTHPRLVQGRIPFRYCVYRRGEEIFVDVVRLDEKGGLKDLQAREITHEHFSLWVVAIDRAEGVMIDRLS